MDTTETAQKFLYNGKELQTDLNLDWYDYGARMYQPDLGRFFTQDRYSEKYFGNSPYQYALNNPISNIDINGDSVWVFSRALDGPGGGAVVHTFIVATPDEDNPDGTTYVISFFQDENGNLVGTEKESTTTTNEDGTETTESKTNWGDKDWNTDVNWDKDNLKGKDLIETPKGKTDGEFITDIRSNAKKQDDAGYKYKAITKESNCSTSGNCNSSTTTILHRSGVSVEIIKQIDPPGYNPGLGIVNKKK